MADQTLDAKGLNCPLPILKAKKALNTVDADGTLEVLSTDPGSVADFEAFCRTTGRAGSRRRKPRPGGRLGPARQMSGAIGCDIAKSGRIRPPKRRARTRPRASDTRGPTRAFRIMDATPALNRRGRDTAWAAAHEFQHQPIRRHP